MSTAHRYPRQANEPVWLARCPIDSPGFEGAYVISAPSPPILQRTSNKFFVWNYGVAVLSPTTYHRLFKGLRLHPSEGPRRVNLRVERADRGPWIARYGYDVSYPKRSYVFGTHPSPALTHNRAQRPNWSPALWTISRRTFIDIFSGIRLPPDTGRTTVSITATIAR